MKNKRSDDADGHFLELRPYVVGNFVIAYLNIDAVIMFDFLHDKSAFDGSNIVMAADDIQKELLVIFHVGSLDAEEVVKRSGNIVTFRHLWYGLYHFGKGQGHFPVQSPQFDAAEYGKALIQFVCIQDCRVLTDYAGAF